MRKVLFGIISVMVMASSVLADGGVITGRDGGVITGFDGGVITGIIAALTGGVITG